MFDFKNNSDITITFILDTFNMQLVLSKFATIILNSKTESINTK